MFVNKRRGVCEVLVEHILVYCWEEVLFFQLVLMDGLC